MKALALALAFVTTTHAQVIISDDFDIPGDHSTTTGFDTDGVNTDLVNRLTGQAAIDQPLSYFASAAFKVDTAYSIANNTLQATAVTGVGALEYTADGFTAFDFGDYLRGKVYEIQLTFDNDSVNTANRRFSFTLGSAPGQAVNASPLSIQLQADADQAGARLYKRVRAASDPGGMDINQAISPSLPYGDPVDVRLVITDVDTLLGLESSYEIYVNGGATPVDSGDFGISSTSRHLIFDVAPDTGPVSYDDFSVTVTGDAPEPPAITGDRYLYFIGNDGAIYGFTGIDTGDAPVTVAGNFTAGVLEATQFDYASYQAFTSDPTSGIIYGINSFGDVVTWPTLADWLTNTNADVPADGDPRFEAYGSTSVHDASYDANTGGFYVVYEGGPEIDGDIGEYATVHDFTTNTNAVVTTSVYGGNLLNFYYWGEDAPGTREAPNDAPGANYFQAAGSGALEGFQTLADYVSDPNNRTFGKGGFATGAIAAFALPMPVEPDLDFHISDVNLDGSGLVTEATLEFLPQPSTSYSLLASPDLATPFTPVSGFENITSSPVTVPVPAGFATRGFFRLMENP